MLMKFYNYRDVSLFTLLDNAASSDTRDVMLHTHEDN